MRRLSLVLAALAALLGALYLAFAVWVRWIDSRTGESAT